MTALDNSVAIEAIRTLQRLGYTGEDVAAAMIVMDAVSKSKEPTPKWKWQDGDFTLELSDGRTWKMCKTGGKTYRIRLANSDGDCDHYQFQPKTLAIAKAFCEFQGEPESVCESCDGHGQVNYGNSHNIIDCPDCYDVHPCVQLLWP